MECNDDDEQVLLKEYELKLAKLRVGKSVSSPIADLKQDPLHQSAGTLSLNRAADGALRLSRPAQEPPKTEVNTEQRDDGEQLPATAPPSEAAAAPKISVKSLDAYSQAAINALQKKATATKEAAQAKSKAKAAAGKKPSDAVKVKAEPRAEPKAVSARDAKKARKLAVLKGPKTKAKAKGAKPKSEHAKNIGLALKRNSQSSRRLRSRMLCPRLQTQL